jgi:putative addiction module component (TIGR02574 family)
MTATTRQFQQEMMRLPEAERCDLLAATLEESGEDFAADFLNAMESARRCAELESGKVKPLTREQVFARVRALLTK